MKLVSGLILFALMPLFANGQTTTLEKSTVAGIVTVTSGKKGTPNSNAKRAFVLFTDAQNKKYSIYTDDNGEYKIDLDPGKYEVYAAKEQRCIFCIEYFNKEFVVPGNQKTKLDIVLRFISEG